MKKYFSYVTMNLVICVIAFAICGLAYYGFRGSVKSLYHIDQIEYSEE
jgi:hypothetical protein